MAIKVIVNTFGKNIGRQDEDGLIREQFQEIPDNTLFTDIYEGDVAFVYALSKILAVQERVNAPQLNGVSFREFAAQSVAIVQKLTKHRLRLNWHPKRKSDYIGGDMVIRQGPQGVTVPIPETVAMLRVEKRELRAEINRLEHSLAIQRVVEPVVKASPEYLTPVYTPISDIKNWPRTSERGSLIKPSIMAQLYADQNTKIVQLEQVVRTVAEAANVALAGTAGAQAEAAALGLQIQEERGKCAQKERDLQSAVDTCTMVRAENSATIARLEQKIEELREIEAFAPVDVDAMERRHQLEMEQAQQTSRAAFEQAQQRFEEELKKEQADYALLLQQKGSVDTDELQQQLLATRNDLLAQMSAKTQLESVSIGQAATIKFLEANIARTSDETDGQKRKLDIERGKLKKATKSLAEARAALATAESTRDSAQQQLRDLEEEKVALQGRLSAAEDANAALVGEKEEFRTLLEAEREIKTNLESNITSKDERISADTLEKAELTTRIDTLTEELRESREANTRGSDELALKERELNELKETHAVLRIERNTLEESLAQSSATMLDLRAQVAALEAAPSGAASETDRALAQAQSENATLRATAGDSQRQISQLTAEKAALEQASEEAAAEHAEVVQMRNDYQVMLARMVFKLTQVDPPTGYQGKHHDDYRVLEQGLPQTEYRIRKVIDEVEELRVVSSQLQTANDQLETQGAADQAKILDQTERLRRLNETHLSLKAALEAIRTALTTGQVQDILLTAEQMVEYRAKRGVREQAIYLGQKAATRLAALSRTTSEQVRTIEQLQQQANLPKATAGVPEPYAEGVRALLNDLWLIVEPFLTEEQKAQARLPLESIGGVNQLVGYIRTLGVQYQDNRTALARLSMATASVERQLAQKTLDVNTLENELAQLSKGQGSGTQVAPIGNLWGWIGRAYVGYLTPHLQEQIRASDTGSNIDEIVLEAAVRPLLDEFFAYSTVGRQLAETVPDAQYQQLVNAALRNDRETVVYIINTYGSVKLDVANALRAPPDSDKAQLVIQEWDGLGEYGRAIISKPNSEPIPAVLRSQLDRITADGDELRVAVGSGAGLYFSALRLAGLAYNVIPLNLPGDATDTNTAFVVDGDRPSGYTFVVVLHPGPPDARRMRDRIQITARGLELDLQVTEGGFLLPLERQDKYMGVAADAVYIISSNCNFRTLGAFLKCAQLDNSSAFAEQLLEIRFPLPLEWPLRPVAQPAALPLTTATTERRPSPMQIAAANEPVSGPPDNRYTVLISDIQPNN